MLETLKCSPLMLVEINVINSKSFITNVSWDKMLETLKCSPLMLVEIKCY